MTEAKIISVVFWVSGALLLLGVLMLNMTLPAALITLGCLGLTFSFGWFLQWLRAQ